MASLKLVIKLNLKQMHYLGSNPCNVTVGYKFLMKYIWACVLSQLHMNANNDLKQLIIPKCHIGVYHNGGINANHRNSMFDGRQDYVKKVATKIKKKSSSICHFSCIDIDKKPFKNPGQDKLIPATPPQVPLYI